MDCNTKKNPTRRWGQVCGASRSDGHGVILVVAVGFGRVVDLRVLGVRANPGQGVHRGRTAGLVGPYRVAQRDPDVARGLGRPNDTPAQGR